MTPQELLAQIQALEATIKQLQRSVAELEAWKRARERQQLSNPVDLASKNLIKQAAS
jgi:prefoldin subunit 5